RFTLVLNSISFPRRRQNTAVRQAHNQVVVSWTSHFSDRSSEKRSQRGAHALRGIMNSPINGDSPLRRYAHVVVKMKLYLIFADAYLNEFSSDEEIEFLIGAQSVHDVLLRQRHGERSRRSLERPQHDSLTWTIDTRTYDPLKRILEIVVAIWTDPMVTVFGHVASIEVSAYLREFSAAELTMIMIPTLAVGLIRSPTQLYAFQKTLLSLKTPI